MKNWRQQGRIISALASGNVGIIWYKYKYYNKNVRLYTEIDIYGT